MTPLALSQLLSLYNWFALTAILLITMMIARFYQRIFGDKTHFHLFFMPIVLFALAVVRYNSINQLMGDALGDVTSALGAALLIGLILRLYRQMTSGRRGDPQAYILPKEMSSMGGDSERTAD